MSFHKPNRKQESTEVEPMDSHGKVQHKPGNEPHTFDSYKNTDLQSPTKSINPGSVGTSASSRFARDFSRVKLHADEALQTLPSHRTHLRVQRFPRDESASCPTCPEAASPETTATAENTAETVPTPVAPEPTTETAAPGENPAPGFIVEDSTAEPGPGQMRKRDFLEQLWAEVRRAVEDAIAGTGRTIEECPYLDYWFEYYSRQDSGHIERAIHRYAPEASNVTSARGYISIITQRARQAAETWARTGEITGVPEGFTTSLPGEEPAQSEESAASTTGPVMLKAREEGARATNSPQAILTELGEGQVLEGSVRSRMEPAFGMDFAQVRTHTDTTAGDLSDDFKARAFTVGQHIAFGSGEYQPGTLKGDALIAHELAHVIQQRDSSSARANMSKKDTGDTPLETDADVAAAGVLTSIWGKTMGFMANMSQNAIPRLRSGLSLQRCSLFDSEEAISTSQQAPSSQTPPPQPVETQPAPPDPRTTIVSFIEGTLSDNRIIPSEWASIGKRAGELNINDWDLSSILSSDMDFDSDYGDLFALLAVSDNPAIRKLSTNFTTTVSQPPRRTFSPEPYSQLVTQALANSSLDQDELNALRQFMQIYDADSMNTELSRNNIDETTRQSLISIMELGQSEYQAVTSRPGLFPIRLRGVEGGGIGAVNDLRSTFLQGLATTNVWRHRHFPRIRAILGHMNHQAATAYLQAAQFEQTSAEMIAREFTRPDAQYRHWVETRRDLELRFQRNQSQWELTPQSQQDLSLPWHPTPVTPLAAAGGRTTQPTPTSVTTIDSYSFDSGVTQRADRFTYQFRNYTFTVIMAETLSTGDETVFDRVENALSVIPGRHLQMVRQLVLDPGNDPGGLTIATASRSGTINMYFSGAGPQVAQSSLNSTTAHEFGHLVSFTAAASDSDFWTNWEEAMENDGIGVSRYGFTNELEDFAESYLLYLSGGRSDSSTRSRYSHRFTIMDSLF